MELTKDYFDSKFSDFGKTIDEKIEAQSKDLKNFVTVFVKQEISEQTESLARMVNTGFDHVSLQLEEIRGHLKDSPGNQSAWKTKRK